MRILVTGGAGYIGSVVTEELIAARHEAVVYDSLYKGHRAAIHEAATFVHADLLDREALCQVLQRHQIEAVIHLAADSLVGESVADPAKYYRNNVTAGLSLLDGLREAGVTNIVFSSTAAVYGEPNKQPIEESDRTAPTNPYGETKLAFERALHWYHQAYSLNYVSLRYFNAAGATERNGEVHDPETHLIPLVLQAAAGTRPDITIFGDDYPTRDGTCVRDYIHVKDLARAHVLAVDALATNRCRAEIYNLGCGGGYTVREVIAAAEEVTGRKVKMNVGPRRDGDPAVLIASSARIQRELAWRPELQDLSVIISSAWNWMRNRWPRSAGAQP